MVFLHARQIFLGILNPNYQMLAKKVYKRASGSFEVNANYDPATYSTLALKDHTEHSCQHPQTLTASHPVM
jgi:hypothetical protein